MVAFCLLRINRFVPSVLHCISLTPVRLNILATSSSLHRIICFFSSVCTVLATWQHVCTILAASFRLFAPNWPLVTLLQRMPMNFLENLLSSWKTEFQKIHIQTTEPGTVALTWPLTHRNVLTSSGYCQATVKLRVNVEYIKINYLIWRWDASGRQITRLTDENRAEYENVLICVHWPVCLPGILRIFLITDSETNTTHFSLNFIDN
jgi:hypothetical protein